MLCQMYNSRMCIFSNAVTTVDVENCCTLLSIINIMFKGRFNLLLCGRVLHKVHSEKCGTPSLVAVSFSEKYNRLRLLSKQKLVVTAYFEKPASPEAHTETLRKRLQYINLFKLLPCSTVPPLPSATVLYKHVSCLHSPDTLMMNYIWPKQIAKTPACV